LKRLVAGVSGYICDLRDQMRCGSEATWRIRADGPKPLI
jgi:hypothetical protein